MLQSLVRSYPFWDEHCDKDRAPGLEFRLSLSCNSTRHACNSFGSLPPYLHIFRVAYNIVNPKFDQKNKYPSAGTYEGYYLNTFSGLHHNNLFITIKLYKVPFQSRKTNSEVCTMYIFTTKCILYRNIFITHSKSIKNSKRDLCQNV